MIRSASFVLAAVVTVCSFGSLSAQVTAVDRQLSRIDIGISGAGEFTHGVTGTVLSNPPAPNSGTLLSEDASNTLGALVDIRYIAKPLVGFELNYGYVRYTENLSYPQTNFGVQTNANEYTLGYVATPAHPIFGLQPFASVGLGTLEFKPTPGGGEGLSKQARAAYYYSVGVQQDVFGNHLGLRASFRQLFYLAPDFGQNYFTIKQHTFTTEPTVGFYIRF